MFTFDTNKENIVFRDGKDLKGLWAKVEDLLDYVIYFARNA